MSAPRRFELDRRAEREIAGLRLGSAILLLPVSVYVLAVDAPMGAKTLAVVGLFGSLIWSLSWVRSRRHLRDAERHYLSLSEDGLTLCLGGDERSVAWASVRDVDVDEDRLVIVVSLDDGQRLDVPPGWEGIGLDGLRDLLEEHARSARSA